MGLLEPASQHMGGDDSWFGAVGDVAVACEDVDLRAWISVAVNDVTWQAPALSRIR